jgi:hypothetical protein
MGPPVGPDGLEPGVTEEDFPPGMGCRIPGGNGVQIPLQGFKHLDFPFILSESAPSLFRERRAVL